MYKTAHKFDEGTVFYFDAAGNKYVATGGSLAWRIHNPGLIRFSRGLGAIGSFGSYAIFPSAEVGRKALKGWVLSKKLVKSVAKHYQPEGFALPPNTKIKGLKAEELDRLLKGIEKLCGYAVTGNEQIALLPRIAARIEHAKGLEDSYLIGTDLILSKKEAVEWVQKHRLDAVIVNEKTGAIHLRSRPRSCIKYLQISEPKILSSVGKIEPLVRTVGEERPGQCIWGFINGINNRKEEALGSASKISQAAGGERVFSLPNDTVLRGAKDVLVCLALKSTIVPSIVQWAAKFFKYLLNLAEKEQAPVVIFAHSQGAMIAERALALLDKKESSRLIVFTFGGGTFIPEKACHPDSHNFASAADFVCRIGEPNLHFLALQRYFSAKKGETESEMIRQWAVNDTLLHLDSADAEIVKTYTKQRIQYYKRELAKIKNVTVLDPDPQWRHKFDSTCYQAALQTIIKKYQSFP